MKSRQHTKYIFVTGGVVSSLGKGIVAASAGALLETRRLKVSVTKADPYINVDPGTMSPKQHGEVYVTDDGAETDLDIGHYERFTHARLTRRNSFSTGQVYDAVIAKERRGDYLGGTVQVVPHVTAQIKENIFRAAEGSDIAIVEIGGTVGDIEGLPFLEAIRQIRYDLGQENVLYIHLTLVPYIKAAQELKTKPTQHSVKELRQIGIQPDILVCRSDRAIPDELKKKIALFCNIKADSVFEAQDVDNIYKIPVILHEQGLDQRIVDRLNIWTAAPDLSEWKRIVENIDHPRDSVKIGVVGKYTDVIDSYKSINESLIHCGIFHKLRIDVDYIDASTLEGTAARDQLKIFDGIIVPGGFGGRGIEGKIQAIKWAREQKVPFFGICLGMQLASIEFARNILGMADANSSEFDKSSKHQIIHLMEAQKGVAELGGTMRLGAYPCDIRTGTRARQAYDCEKISERHRHRYEFNNEYRAQFMERGAVFSGTSPDGNLVEIMEITNHPWYVACQFHPELNSKPMEPHPLFREFVEAAYQGKKARLGVTPRDV
jgi:CTP synthase